MLKIIIDTNVIIMSHINGKNEATPRKRFYCPYCGAEVAFYNYSPLSCPVCKKGLVDLDKVLEIRPHGRIAFFQGRNV